MAKTVWVAGNPPRKARVVRTMPGGSKLVEFENGERRETKANG